MADREKQSDSKKTKEREEKMRDLPPQKDVKGGNGHSEKEKRRTAEVDFMQHLDD